MAMKTPSTKAIIEVKAFDVDYLLQFIHEGKVLFTVGERAGPGGAHDGFFIWEGTGLEPDMLITAQWHEYTADDDPLVTAALETFP